MKRKDIDISKEIWLKALSTNSGRIYINDIPLEPGEILILHAYEKYEVTRDVEGDEVKEIVVDKT